MKIETKFNMNDLVYPIRQGGYDEFINCTTCNGARKVNINNSERTIMCPDCYGQGGSKKFKYDKWVVETESVSKIGKISTEMYRPLDSKEDRITYMIDATGIGSGTLWDEKQLFLTIEEAKSECDRLNKLNLNIEPPSFIQQGGKH